MAGKFSFARKEIVRVDGRVGVMVRENAALGERMAQLEARVRHLEDINREWEQEESKEADGATSPTQMGEGRQGSEGRSQCSQDGSG